MSYDPLHSISPGEGLDHVDSYWAATAGPSPGDDGRLQSPIETDVAIIGGGYTGLSCAFHLAKRYGVRPVVLEANRPVWVAAGEMAVLPDRHWAASHSASGRLVGGRLAHAHSGLRQ